jgi:uncharacterized protein
MDTFSHVAHNPIMRLSVHEQRALAEIVTAVDPDAEVWLHGSRTDDDGRGGDIDLLVMSQRIGLAEKLDILARLHATLGDRKIDITVARDDQRPFVRLARARGIQL